MTYLGEELPLVALVGEAVDPGGATGTLILGVDKLGRSLGFGLYLLLKVPGFIYSDLNKKYLHFICIIALIYQL